MPNAIQRFKALPRRDKLIFTLPTVVLVLVLAVVVFSSTFTSPSYVAKIPVGENLPPELVTEPITYMGADGTTLEFATPDGERRYSAIGSRADGPLPMPFFKHKTFLKQQNPDSITIYVND